MPPLLSVESISSANWSTDIEPLLRTTSLYCRYKVWPSSAALPPNTLVQNGSSTRASDGIDAILASWSGTSGRPGDGEEITVTVTDERSDGRATYYDTDDGMMLTDSDIRRKA